MKKKIAVAVSLLLVLALSVGGTIAWLTDSDSVTNTFTIGNVNITLTETDTALDTDQNDKTNTYKFVPGKELAKDPKVTVTANSEKCYVFVKFKESISFNSSVPAEDRPGFSSYFDYGIASAEGWQILTNGNTPVSGVYFKEVETSTENQTIQVLEGSDTNKDGCVKVYGTVTKADIEKLDMSHAPTLTITAAAVQYDGMSNAYDAWTKLPSNITGIDD